MAVSLSTTGNVRLWVSNISYSYTKFKMEYVADPSHCQSTVLKLSRSSLPAFDNVCYFVIQLKQLNKSYAVLRGLSLPFWVGVSAQSVK